MSQPGVLGGLMPASPGDLMRRIVDIERTVRELQGARILNSASAGDSGLAIIGGAIEMPLITFGIPASLYWDDGYDHHGALFQSPARQTVLASPFNNIDPNHPALLLDAGGKIVQLYVSQDDPSIDEPYLVLAGQDGSQDIELFVNNGSTGNKYSTFVVHNGLFVQKNTVGHGQVFLGQGGSDEHTSVAGAAFFVDPGVLMQYGPGDQGLYYYEDWDLAAQTVTAGSQDTLIGMALGTQRTDYPTALDPATGLWTAPADGPYHFTFVAGFDTWASGSRLQLRIFNSTRSRTIASRDTNPAVTVDAKDTLTARRHLTAGDQVIFQILNGSAATRSVTATGVEAGYISVQREM